MKLLVYIFFLHELAGGLIAKVDHLRIRGGSTTIEEEDEEDAQIENEEEVKQWIMEQILRRQERVAILSSSLAERGLPFCSVQSISNKSKKNAISQMKSPHWICVESTDQDPKSCLIWGDAEPGTKVVRPRDAHEQWVSLSALNSLRRRDPVKASRLWFDQYLLDLRRFSHEAGTLGLAVGIFLESSSAVRTAAIMTCLITAFFARPFLQFFLISFVASPILWRHYGMWSPVVHAPFPLKLLIVRQLFILATSYFLKLERAIVTYATEIESMLFERYAFITSSNMDDAVSVEDKENNDIPSLQPIDRLRSYAHEQIFGKKAQQWSSSSTTSNFLF